jgi:hypothetical protein
MQKSNIKMQNDNSKVKSKDMASNYFASKNKFLHFYLSFWFLNFDFSANKGFFAALRMTQNEGLAMT